MHARAQTTLEQGKCLIFKSAFSSEVLVLTYNLSLLNAVFLGLPSHKSLCSWTEFWKDHFAFKSIIWLEMISKIY